MTRARALLSALAATALSLQGCSRCADSGESPAARARRDAAPPPPPGSARTARRADAGPEATADASAESRALRPPQVTAQRFIVGWASRRLDGLEAMSADRAAALVGRARAGETVETPLGEYGPEGARATSFAFSQMSLAQASPGVVRVSFTATLRYPDGEPVASRHSLLIRVEDGVVLDWISPDAAETPDGGV